MSQSSEPAGTQNPQDAITNEIWVVLPAYNEESNLPGLLTSIGAELGTGAYRYHILVVDDGSRDRTAEIVREMSGSVPAVLVQHQVNQGLGVTIRDGLREASERAGAGAVIVTMDADQTHTPNLIPKMLEKLRTGNDVVSASRYQPGAKVLGLSAYRTALSLGAAAMFKIACPIRGVRDYTCGYRAYRVNVLRNAFARYGDRFVETSGFDCMAEILVKLRPFKLRFGEVPMILRYDLKGGASKMNVLRTVRRTAGLALRSLFTGG
ncbi:MAG: glycosyltransferase [Bryobacterales bacterium]|nr:glycosyltransferase [Bryobacterales bacterium]